MKKKLSMILTVLMLILRLPVSAAAMSATEEVTIQTELFSGFDITIPKSIAEKCRWEEIGFEGTNTINFYDRAITMPQMKPQFRHRAEDTCSASASITMTAIIVTEWAISNPPRCSSRPVMKLWPFIAGTICQDS